MNAETTAPDRNGIAAYLRRHPAFLKDFPDLAMTLEIPREQGPAASLVGYRLEALREKVAANERRLGDLLRVAADNEQLILNVHALNLALIRAGNGAQTLRALVASLAEDFHTEHVRFVLFPAIEDAPVAEWLLWKPEGSAGWPEFHQFLSRGEPLCGRLAPEKHQALFAAQADQVKSIALIKIGAVGMLAIGSTDPNRFHPGIGTLFLKLIGESVAAALERFLDRA